MNQGLILGILVIFALSPFLISDSYGINSNVKSEKTSKNNPIITMTKDSGVNTKCGNKCFTPNVLTVQKGTTVTWKNEDSIPHMISLLNGKFDSGAIAQGGQVSHTFDQTGSFEYQCFIHPWTMGKIIVKFSNKEPISKNTVKSASKSQTLSPKSFMVYENNLSSDYTLVESNSVPPMISDGVKSFHQNTFSHNGMINALVTEFSVLPDEVKQKMLSANPEHDKIVFTLPDSLGKCQAIGNLEYISVNNVGSIACYLGNWYFSSGIDSNSNEDMYKFMDIMLKKYYQAQGKQFNQSTKDLVKNGQKIPKKELTYNEQINSLVNVDFIGCSASGSGNYLSWKGSLTSLATIPIDVDIVLTGLDSSKNIVTFEKHTIRDLYPGQTEYIDRFLDNNYEITSCGYKIERVKPSN